MSTTPLITSALLLAGCSSPCERALEHFEHLAFEVTKQERMDAST